MSEPQDTHRGSSDPSSDSLDAELARPAERPRRLREPVAAGGSLRIGVLAGFVASFIPTALFFSGGGMQRAAILVGSLLLLMAAMLAVRASRRRTGVGAIAGLLVGAVLTSVVAFVTFLFDAFAHAPF